MNFELLANLDHDGMALARRELNDHAPLWDAFTTRQTLQGSPHVDTKCIPLRGLLSFPFALDIVRPRTPFAARLPSCMRLANYVLSCLPVQEVGNVMLAKLRPGGRILPHPDEGPYAEHFTRYHLVIDSHAGNWFDVAGHRVSTEQGDLFTFNHHLVHSAGNDSERDRIHMILDLTLKD